MDSFSAVAHPGCGGVFLGGRRRDSALVGRGSRTNDCLTEAVGNLQS